MCVISLGICTFPSACKLFHILLRKGHGVYKSSKLSSKATYLTLPYNFLILFVPGIRKRSAQSPIFEETSIDEAVVTPLYRDW